MTWWMYLLILLGGAAGIYVLYGVCLWLFWRALTRWWF